MSVNTKKGMEIIIIFRDSATTTCQSYVSLIQQQHVNNTFHFLKRVTLGNIFEFDYLSVTTQNMQDYDDNENGNKN